MYDKDMSHHTTPIDKLIRDKDNNVAIVQFPNLPLIGWAVFGLLSYLLSSGRPHAGLLALSHASLFTWAYLEIRSGVSLFRRLLGIIILLGIVASYFNK